MKSENAGKMTTRIVTVVVGIIVCIGDAVASWTRSLVGRRHRPGCVVLYYHSVSLAQLAQFQRQMDVLKRHAVAVPLIMQGLTLGVRNVSVTFDDGFEETIDNVIPILRRIGIPFTVFVPTGNIGQLPRWIRDQERARGCGVVVSATRLKLLHVDPLATIGSHCTTHRALETLCVAEANSELVDSKNDLERLLGVKIAFLSFPYGSFRAHHVKMAIDAGYERVFSTAPHECDPSAYVCGRVRVEPTDWPIEFRLKLAGAYRWLPVAYAMKRGLRNMFGGQGSKPPPGL